jgi:HD-like signal output (HDOD) protein
MSVQMADLLDTVDDLAARRPVAARVVAMTGDDTSSSKDLAAVLMADVTLTARVMRLANSAYYGLGGRVRTVTFAVTVIGFSTIRSMAAVAVAGVDTSDLLPQDTWTRSTAAAVACGELASAFALPPPDAFCLGLLAGLGQAILVQHDTEAYQALLAREDVVAGGRAGLMAAELEEYGFRHTEVSAAALSAWAFPHELAEALHHLDSPDLGTPSPWTLCLRSAMELATRLVAPGEPEQDLLALSGGLITADRLEALLPRVRDALARSEW